MPLGKDPDRQRAIDDADRKALEAMRARYLRPKKPEAASHAEDQAVQEQEVQPDLTAPASASLFSGIGPKDGKSIMPRVHGEDQVLTIADAVRAGAQKMGLRERGPTIVEQLKQAKAPQYVIDDFALNKMPAVTEDPLPPPSRPQPETPKPQPFEVDFDDLDAFMESEEGRRHMMGNGPMPAGMPAPAPVYRHPMRRAAVGTGSTARPPAKKTAPKLLRPMGTGSHPPGATRKPAAPAGKKKVGPPSSSIIHIPGMPAPAPAGAIPQRILTPQTDPDAFKKALPGQKTIEELREIVEEILAGKKVIED